MKEDKMSAARRAAMENQRDREAVILLIIFAVITAVICLTVACEAKNGENDGFTVIDEQFTVVQATPAKQPVLGVRKPIPHKLRETPVNEWEQAETVIETAEQADTGYRYHTVNGHTFPLEEFLYNTLAEYGREDFIEYALCQCYQESRFDVYAINPNGHDKGLFQFKDIYWDYYSSAAGFGGEDIYDPYVQCAVYAFWVDRRFRESADLYTTISDHYTGGKGYSSKYVSDVLQWLGTVE